MSELHVFALSCFATSFFTIVLGVFSLAKSKQKYVSSLFIFYLAVSIWSAGLGLKVTAPNKEMAFFWAYFLLTGVIFIPPTFLRFVYHFMDTLEEKRKVLSIAYLTTALMLILNFTGLITKDVRPIFYFNYYVEPAFGYYILLAYFCFWITYSFVQLWCYSKESSQSQKNKIKYFCNYSGIP